MNLTKTIIKRFRRRFLGFSHRPQVRKVYDAIVQCMGKHLIVFTISEKLRRFDAVLELEQRVFYHALLEVFAPTGDRWFHPQSYVSDLLVWLPFSHENDTENKTLTGMRKKQYAMLGRKTISFFIVHCTIVYFFLEAMCPRRDREKSGSIVGNLAT